MGQLRCFPVFPFTLYLWGGCAFTMLPRLVSDPWAQKISLRLWL